MRKTFITMLLVASVVHSALAGGYQVRLQGARQTGMGLVGTPLSAGASSIFYNPGALGFTKSKLEFTAGVNAIMSKITYRSIGSDYTAKTDNPISPPFFVYGAGKITDKLTLGLGVYTPYGSKAVWDDNWKGRYLIQNIGLKAYYFQPTVSYQLCERIGIGAGLVYVMGDVTLQKALPYNDNSYVNLTGKTNSFGFNVGVLAKPTDKLSIGLNYRSKVEVKLEGGDATFVIPQSLSTQLPAANKFGAMLPMPANADFGIAYQVNEKLLVAVELDWVMWSTYDSLSFTFEEKGEVLNSNSPRLYEDSFIPRIGIEYTVSPSLQVRTGAYYDTSPVNSDYFSPETVSLNTTAFSFGLSFKPISNLSIDLSYLHLMGQESDKKYTPDNFEGTYKSNTAIPGFGITYSF
jgi:long-chain fatty acid transport protein